MCKHVFCQDVSGCFYDIITPVQELALEEVLHVGILGGRRVRGESSYVCHTTTGQVDNLDGANLGLIRYKS